MKRILGYILKNCDYMGFAILFRQTWPLHRNARSSHGAKCGHFDVFDYREQERLALNGPKYMYIIFIDIIIWTHQSSFINDIPISQSKLHFTSPNKNICRTGGGYAEKILSTSNIDATQLMWRNVQLGDPKISFEKKVRPCKVVPPQL